MRIHDFIRHAKLTHGRGHRLKKPKRLLPALAIELSYATEIHLLQFKLKKVIDQVVVPKIESLVKQAGNVRLDFNENHDERGRFSSGASSAASHAVYEKVGARFGIPASAVRDVAMEPVEKLRQRYKDASVPNNGTSPQDFPRHPTGSAALPDWGDPNEAYLEYLREVSPKDLKLSEGEQGIKQTPTYEAYREWARKGIEAPYISVAETDKGTMVSSNRRRTLVAQELGQRSIKAWFGPHNKETQLPLKYGDVRRAVDAARGSIRLDDWTDGLDRAIELARATFNGITPREDIQDLALKYAQETSKYQRAQLAQSLQTAIGVNVFFDNAKLLGRMKAHVKQNVDLITSIDEDLLNDIKGRLTTGIRSGTRVEELRDMIEERYDVTKSKASLIARDQVGKFYGELNRDRQTSLGINSYTWRGTLDQRERPMHVDLEGEVFQWGQPPITNSNDDRNEPGGDYQCRCTAEPVLDDLAL